MFFKYDRRIFQNFDKTLFALVMSICAIGVVNIYSTGFSLGENATPLYLKQIQWIAFGLFFMMVAFLIDYRYFNRAAYGLYAFSMASLVAVALFGHTANGAQRWISFGVFLFQPSELMKISIILALARYFDDHKSHEPYRLRELLVPFGMVMLPCALILKQPDLGTALMIVLVSASIVLFIGMNWKSIVIAVASVMVLMPPAWHF